LNEHRTDGNVSETAERSPGVQSAAPGSSPPGNNFLGTAKRGLTIFGQQREATVFIVVVALVIYFKAAAPAFATKDNLVNISQITAPVAIIAIGEVLLLVCGEIDLSVGFIFVLSPFVMHFLIDYYSVPVIPAVLVALLMGVAFGYINGFITVTLRVPSFIATLGTGFVILGIMQVTSHDEPVNIPAKAVSVGQWLGADAWAEIIWAVVLVAIFHVLLTRTRWGLHTVAVGGNMLGASEAGISVARIKMAAFMISGFMGALVGMQEAFRVSDIDPTSGGYQPMFYAVAAAVLGGTALTGGSGTIIGAFFGALLLAILSDGFNLLGISADPLPIILGAAILVAMIANVQLARLRRAGKT
jgi:simple sugar transport system permease protein